MTTRFPICCTALVLTACLVLTAGPAFAAPGAKATGTLAATAASTPAPGLPSTLLDKLQELWTEMVAPVDRLFGANGKTSDPPEDDEPVFEPLLGGKIDPNGQLNP